MRKLFTFFALLFVATPFAIANSVDFDTGTFKSGKLAGSFSTSINASIVGSLDTIDLQTGNLVKTTVGCPAGATCYDFTGGSVNVSNASRTVFKDSITGGITIKGNGVASIVAVLSPEAGVLNGSAVATFTFNGGKITTGSEDISFNTTVPEPSTLLFLGTGLLGLLARFRPRKET